MLLAFLFAIPLSVGAFDYKYQEILSYNRTLDHRSEAVLAAAAASLPKPHIKPAETRLQRYLLDNYDPEVRPVTNHSSTINVTFGLSLSQIIDVDEKNQILTTNSWLNQQWYDYQLTWDPDDFDGIQVIRMRHNAVWKPDIVLYNNAHVTDGLNDISTNVIINYEGNVTWLSMVVFKSSCAIDVKFFPFDQQNCTMFFASWSFDGYQVNMVYTDVEGDVSNFIENSEWHLIQLLTVREEKIFSCCPNEPYPAIQYYIIIRRRPLFYVFNMMLPCVLITLVALLGFYIPSESGEKVTMGITTLLSMTVFLMLVADSMPPTKSQLPLLGLFYGFTIVVVSCATAMTVLTLNIHHKGRRGARLPNTLRFLCFKIFAKMLFFHLELPKDPSLWNKAQNNTAYQALPRDDTTRNGSVSGGWWPAKRKYQDAGFAAQKYITTVLDKVKKDSNGVRLHSQDDDCHHPLAEHQKVEESSCTQGPDSEILTVLRSLDRSLIHAERRIIDQERIDYNKLEWEQAAMVLDRLLLIIFLGVTVSVTGSIFVQSPNKLLFGDDEVESATDP